MSRVIFKFQNGKERKMPTVLAEVLYRKGMGTYLTRDMVASRPTIQPLDSRSGNPISDELVDSAGDVWNPELHVASKLKNQNGTWRKKPGAAAHAAEESAE